MLKTIIWKFVDQFLFLIELGQHLLSHDALAWDSVRKKGDAGFQRPTRYDDKVSAYAARLSRAGVLSVAHFGVRAGAGQSRGGGPDAPSCREQMGTGESKREAPRGPGQPPAGRRPRPEQHTWPGTRKPPPQVCAEMRGG